MFTVKFFKRLNSKRSRDVLSRIHLDDGTIVNDGSSIAHKNAPYTLGKFSVMPLFTAHSQIFDIASDTMMSYVDPCIDISTSTRIDSLFEKSKLLCALQHLGNEKTPSMDDI